LQIEGEGANTLSLLERAQAHVKKSNNLIKHVWLVYDQDDFPRDNFDNTKNKCESISQPDNAVIYHALWSNQCVELWYLLHFAYHQEDLHRSEYSPKLDVHFKNIDGSKYRKNRDDIYSILKEYLPDAIRNAKALIQYHNNTVPSKNAPGTSIYEIFEFFYNYLGMK